MPRREFLNASLALADWRRNGTVVRLTERILKLDLQDKLERVAKAVKIGALLAEIRERHLRRAASLRSTSWAPRARDRLRPRAVTARVRSSP
jgi:hypothetical protein